MPRTRASAKQAGTRMESAVASYLAQHVDDRIERRAKTGGKDRGDLTGFRHMGARIVVEIKNTARLDLAGWAAEAEVERGNDDAAVGMVVHKRHGRGDPADQWVTMTLGDLVSLINGNRVHLRTERGLT